MDEVLVLSCSPRRGGNADFAAELVLEAFGGSGRIMRPADGGIGPCRSCGRCEAVPGTCSIAGDGADAVFEAMFSVPLTVFVSPVYFYHLPAQAKALVDRMQRWWGVPEAERPGRGRLLAPLLFGARRKGVRLFEGSLLTLKYAAAAAGMALCPASLAYGLEGPSDLRRDEAAREALRQAAAAWRAAAIPERG
ncbi:MAG: NAD(P)H-dependent oxidoreductase [Mailhella sp.]|nr:NAD(P)H-dependent oxidoreductase [Mailhella sp.]